MKLKSSKQQGIFFNEYSGELNFSAKIRESKNIWYDMNKKTFKTFKQTDGGKISHLKIAHFECNF